MFFCKVSTAWTFKQYDLALPLKTREKKRKDKYESHSLKPDIKLILQR